VSAGSEQVDSPAERPRRDALQTQDHPETAEARVISRDVVEPVSKDPADPDYRRLPKTYHFRVY
jgi:hypothetical protein